MKKITYLLCAVLALGLAASEADATPSDTHDTFVCALDLSSDAPSVTCAKEIEHDVTAAPVTVPATPVSPAKIENVVPGSTPLDPAEPLNHNDGCFLSDHSCEVAEPSGSNEALRNYVAQINKENYVQKSWRASAVSAGHPQRKVHAYQRVTG